jgi:hypothetical protein
MQVHLRKISRPFETTRGGYQITMRAGRVTETFGSKDGVRHGGPPPAPQRAQEGAAQSGKHRAAAMDALAAGIAGKSDERAIRAAAAPACAAPRIKSGSARAPIRATDEKEGPGGSGAFRCRCLATAYQKRKVPGANL